MLSYISGLVLGAVAFAMFSRAHFEFTRTVAFVPAVMAAAELYFASVLEPAAFPVLTALLVVLRVAAVAVGVYTLRTDAQLAERRREARRRASRQLFCASHSIEPVVAKQMETAYISKVA